MVIIAEIINHGISWDHIWVNLRSTSLRPHYSKKARPSHFFEGLWYVSFISGPWTCPHLAAAGGWHDRLFRSVNCSNLFQTMMRLCLIGGLEHVFFHVLGIIIPIDFHIFQTGWNHQPVYEFHTSHSSTRPIKLHNFNHVISKNHFHMDPRYQSWFPVIFTLSGYITIKPKTCIICVFSHIYIYIYVYLIPTVSKVVSFQLMFLRQVLVWQKLQFGAYVSLFCHTGLTKLLINFEVLPAACPEKLGCHCFTTQKIICKSTVKMPVQPAVWLLVFSKDVCVCCRS